MECVICYHVGSGVFASGPCGHTQCANCVTKWRDQDPSIEDELGEHTVRTLDLCPICRTQIMEKDLVYTIVEDQVTEGLIANDEVELEPVVGDVVVAVVDVEPVIVDRNLMVQQVEASRQNPLPLGSPVRPGRMLLDERGETVWTHGAGNQAGQMVVDVEGEASWLNAPLGLVVQGQQLPPFNAYTCDICGRSFNSTGHKSQHRETHFRRTPCQVCGSPIGSRQAHARHMRMFHEY
ncbi:unnamed protein product [Allacma fusca]|uniref:Uncharacterized protein n=1 Tax=Allacma fusca TaxID=39272 RepID=A0A8J2KEP5_9HEXA|nr:unnamed protein product [Allacma fusca]